MTSIGLYLPPPPPPPWGAVRSGWLALPAAEELLERVSAGCPVGEPFTAAGAPVDPAWGVATPVELGGATVGACA